MSLNLNRIDIDVDYELAVFKNGSEEEKLNQVHRLILMIVNRDFAIRCKDTQIETFQTAIICNEMLKEQVLNKK